MEKAAGYWLLPAGHQFRAKSKRTETKCRAIKASGQQPVTGDLKSYET